MKNFDFKNINWKKIDAKELLKKEQVKISLAVFIGFAFGFIIFMFTAPDAPEDILEEDLKELKINTASDVLKTDEMAHYHIEDKVDVNKKKTEDLIKEVNEEMALKDAASGKKLETISTKVEDLYKHLELVTEDNRKKDEQLKWLQAQIQEKQEYKEGRKSPSSISISPTKFFKKVLMTIPTATIARGVVIEGADVSTATTSSSDPKPFQVKIKGLGRLPHGVTVDIDQCILKGETKGELSAERGDVRFHTLVCTDKKTKRVSETQVSAHIIGSDAKAGLRGEVVSRAGTALVNMGVSNFIGGIAAAGKRTSAPNWLTGGGETLGFKDRVKNGAIQGFEASGEKISNLFADEYQRIQPVLELSAGQDVDITFDKTSRLEEENMKEKIAKEREENIKELEG